MKKCPGVLVISDAYKHPCVFLCDLDVHGSNRHHAFLDSDGTILFSWSDRKPRMEDIKPSLGLVDGIRDKNPKQLAG